MARRPALRRFAIAAFGVAILVVGCQVIVGSDVPEVRCGSADPSACPTGLTCDLALGRCVTADALDVEVPDVDGDAAVGDARADQDGGLLPLGSPCRVDGECATTLCGTNAMLTPPITSAGATGPVCTKTCCTSADCDLGFVCFGAGTGGNYCIAGTKLGRATMGSKSPGASCASGTECRSGACENMRCLDTCCADGACTNGTVCRIVAIDAGVTHDTWACAAPTGTKDAGSKCANNPECRSNACVPTANGDCRTPCCGRQSCTSAGFPNHQCFPLLSSGDYFWSCYELVGGSSKANGEACQGDVECASRLCDAELKQCAEPCCIDRDCPSTQVCRPASTGPAFLRCVNKPGR